ncbi:MAG: ATP-binding protein [Flavobacteriales bacterium]|jgi:hypothetical protein|nr:ATP-binding protein [Flavobacteriales bacterium]
MEFSDETYVENDGVLWKGVLREVKRARLALQPVYEAFTNALEAIKIREENGDDFAPEIVITIRSTQATDSSNVFDKLTIEDNGIGFNNEEFERFNRYKDFTKGYKNLGSGRIQYAHYFGRTNFVSTYKTENETRKREFVVSKADDFLNNNAIVFHKSDASCDECDNGTRVTFNGLIDSTRRIYHDLTADELKTSLLDRYLQYFCTNKTTLPKMLIKHYVFEELKGECEIEAYDIPNVDKTENITLNYSRISNDSRRIEHTEEFEEFTINSYRIPASRLDENRINLTSKDEIVENIELNLDLLSKKDKVGDDHFMFLISSDYIDDRDSDERGMLKIPTYETFSSNELFSEDEILLDDIQLSVNESLVRMYPEIKEIKEKHESDFERLKEMFLLDDDDIDFKISVNDTENKILEKVYSNEAKKVAAIDANIKNRIDGLDRLDTTSDNYLDLLQEEVEELVRVIPLQNKTALTHYVARRKLVLELFNKILERQLEVQNDGGRNDDEKLLHNLVFQQSTVNPEQSDLWLINEDFIYFGGTSESELKDVKINGDKILRDDLTEEETEFVNSLNENRLAKRPDILLFPEESKCIIIEFKNPNVNVSKHLGQINNYATLLRNLCKPEFEFITFYGYLIGEKINHLDVKAYDGDFVEAYHYDYMFRNHKGISNLFVEKKGSLYMEVIKYSSLLERAKRRNEIFIEKLTKKLEVNNEEEIEGDDS